MTRPTLITLVALAFAAPSFAADVKVRGQRKVGSALTLDITGPKMSETGDPNPFRDIEITVLWSLQVPGRGNKLELIGLAGGRQDPRKKELYGVPAYFAADGAAGETSATEGNVWRSHFVPNLPGNWRYTVLAYQFKDAAIGPVDVDREPRRLGEGVIEIAAAPDARGMLRDVGERYLRFDNGEFFIKAGVDSPENFLAYVDFDGTYRAGGKKIKGLGDGLHRYQPHVVDWREGDPTWRDGKGKGIIGAVNYLADVGVNSVYMITMNHKGDGNDVWPWVSEKNEHRDRFDCSKLDQWNIVFEHMSRRGVMLHILLQETENDQLLDNGHLGDKRKLYLREMVARYAHHPMLVWNLGEENTQTTQQQKAMADYIRSLDPYGHAITIHTYPNQHEKVYKPLLGHESIAGPSVQTNADVKIIHGLTKKWIDRSAEAKRPWAVFIDEPGDAGTGTTPDGQGNNHDNMLRHALWGNLMAGGSGVEWYFGYNNPHNDLNLEDFRSRDSLFRRTAGGVDLFRRLPFHEMDSADDLVNGDGGWCFADRGKIYAVYVHGGASVSLALPKGRWAMRVQDPDTFTAGDPTMHDGGALKLDRSELGKDALYVIRRVN